ncbi:hypothetical protein [Nonomuraea recticatena]
MRGEGPALGRAALDAGADHVALFVLTDTPAIPPVRQWRALAPAVLG